MIPEHDQLQADAVERVLLVSGRLYYDLLSTRQKTEDTTTAIVRVEQLYPLPADEIAAELAKYPNAEVVWAQDEPANQGPVAVHRPEPARRPGPPRPPRLPSCLGLHRRRIDEAPRGRAGCPAQAGIRT